MALFTFPRRTDPADPRSPTGLDGRDFLLLIVATLGTFSNYAPLLSVVSLWSAEGGRGHGGVGAATGVTMATTVGIQLVMGRLLRRYGLRRILAAGALLLGLPTFAYPVSSGLEWVLAVSAVRGVGFGMVAVAGSALVAELVPPGQRGRAVGRYGIAVGLPQVVCLPAGVWCAQQFGFTAVFVVTGAASVLAAPLAGLMSGRRAEEQEEGHAADEAASSGAGAPRAGWYEPSRGGSAPAGRAVDDAHRLRVSSLLGRPPPSQSPGGARSGAYRAGRARPSRRRSPAVGPSAYRLPGRSGTSSCCRSWAPPPCSRPPHASTVGSLRSPCASVPSRTRELGPGSSGWSKGASNRHWDAPEKTSSYTSVSMDRPRRIRHDGREHASGADRRLREVVHR